MSNKTKSAISLLSQAAKKLSNGHWTRGNEVKELANGKVQFCAIGAINHVTNTRKFSDTSSTLARQALAKAIDRNFNPSERYYGSDNSENVITEFNDGAAAEARSIVRKINKAIRTLRSSLPKAKKNSPLFESNLEDLETINPYGY